MGRSYLATVTLPAALLGLASFGELGLVQQTGCCLFSYFFMLSSSRGLLSFSITASCLSVDKGLVSSGYSEGTLKSPNLLFKGPQP